VELFSTNDKEFVAMFRYGIVDAPASIIALDFSGEIQTERYAQPRTSKKRDKNQKSEVEIQTNSRLSIVLNITCKIFYLLKIYHRSDDWLHAHDNDLFTMLTLDRYLGYLKRVIKVLR